MRTVTVCLCFCFCLPVPVQVWGHDRGGERPLDGGHEPLRARPHVEGAKEQSHSDRYLLAWQPGVDFEIGLKSASSFFRFWKENAFVLLCFWLLRAADTAGICRAQNH